MWLPTYQLAVLVTVAGVVLASDDDQLEKDEVIEAINSAQTSWKAGRNFHKSLTKKYLKNLLGWKKIPGEIQLPFLEDDHYVDDIDLPVNFDARKKWKNCISLQEVRDQGPCGSCWAVSTASAFTDRLCIASKTDFNGHLSAQELLTCCHTCGGGCNGGSPTEAWEFFKNNGLVTGGDYHSHEGCQPYTLPQCDHFVTGKFKDCSEYGNVQTPPCKHSCYNKEYTKKSFQRDHHKVKSAFVLNGTDIKQVQKEIYLNGPIVAAFYVYEDFVSYKTGVYFTNHINLCAGHAVKVIGWGVENDIDYWLVANSWNSDWGDKGFFKIRRGTNECGFEELLTAGYPDV